MSVNKVILIGNLGAKPEIKFSEDGKAIAIFSIATSESWTDKTTGEKVEKTEWHRIAVFGKLADIAQKYLDKGSKVYIEGQLRTRSWEKNGEKRYATDIVVSGWNATLQMLNKVTSESVEPTPTNLDVAPEKKIQPVDDFEDDVEDIPF